MREMTAKQEVEESGPPWVGPVRGVKARWGAFTPIELFVFMAVHWITKHDTAPYP
jgi:hypothetical protein